MKGTFALLDIAGYVALLLWGTHMVTSGVLRGYGSALRRWMGRYLGHRSAALGFGVCVTAILQSSTATGLMATSFAASGFLGLAPGLSVMLGANVGTTLIVQVMSFDISIVAPVLVLIGFVIHRRTDDVSYENLGRVSIGLGLMLLALHLLVGAMAPVENAQVLRAILQSLASEPVLAMVVAALLTWACHSSVAVVLLIVSLANAGVVNAPGALALVLGANLGSTIPALMEAHTPVARRLPMGNLLVRAVGCVACLPLLPWLAHALAALGDSPARIVVNFHTAFNLSLALVFIGPVDSLARLLVRLLPEPPKPNDPGVPLYLDEGALDSANVALANAVRESMRMADMVEGMLQGLVKVFGKDDRASAAAIGRADQWLDRLGVAIRDYLADLGGEALNEEDGERSQEILAFVINLEHIGDITANNLMEFAAKKAQNGQEFTAEDIQDLAAMHAQVMESLRLGLTVFLRGDLRAAQQLVARKEVLWRLENEASERHIKALRERRDGGGGADIYLRIVRDLKRIHSHLAALAYLPLERAGLLQDRLVREPAST
ncbi:Na/Pi cotransporter family protein [Dyella jiangningensis]|jgi:phosphate:Na+ symporter|uniref:Na/Pi cotransporter family protein n=1 Tax=Dyella jiangningensis TaxID=1379159 RepID=UPI0024108720|nr:Na/Pi cotransporter family protein [Dyella jiangningensis]MDG2539957.1 Na/Pi cotransporter family protein [Dyella jiangningensis]